MASSSGGVDSQLNPTARDELKSQFSTREGLYRLVSALEISRSIRPPPLPYGTLSTATTQPTGPSPPFRLTFVEMTNKLTEPTSSHNRMSNGEENHRQMQDSDSDCGLTDKFVFNYGKELYVYSFIDNRKITEVGKPIDKRVYKGTFPSCHDFNDAHATQDNLSLLIGFSGGQIQLVDPISKELNKLYNEDRSIDKTRVTCIRWVPYSNNMFYVSHGSGHVYLYNAELSCGTTPPHYQTLKQGPGYVVSSVKTKTPRNPITRWVLGEGAINEFAFSPCGHYWANVSQDGFLRIFRCDTHELEGITRSYFGGLICVCWSPDGKYICVGGEDDLVTVWSFKERRVVARGQGHKSWVAVVAFDPYTTVYDESDGLDESYNSHDPDCPHYVTSNNPASNDFHSSGVFSCDSSSGISSKKQACSVCQSHANSGSPPHVSSNSSNASNPKRRNSALNQVSYLNNASDPNALKGFVVNRFSRPPSENLNSSLRLSISEASGTRVPACYRVGSVGQDTQLCLWDLTEDILKSRTTTARGPGVSESPFYHSNKPVANNALKTNGGGSPSQVSSKSIIGNCISSSSASVVSHSSFPVPLRNNFARSDKDDVDSAHTFTSSSTTQSEGTKLLSFGSKKGSTSSTENGSSQSNSSSGHGILSLRLGGLVGFGNDKSHGKEHKRNFSLGSTSKSNHLGVSGGSNSKANNGILNMNLSNLNFSDPLKLIGTEACPRLDECPLLEPLICKKISHERLTALIFREESIITACQDGVICTWCRPGEELRASSSVGGASSVALQLRNKNLAQDETFNYNNDTSATAMEQL